MSCSKQIVFSQCFRLCTSRGYACFLQVGRQSTVAGASADSSPTAKQTLWMNAKPFSEIPRIKSLPVIGSAWVYLPLVGKYGFDKLHVADKRKYEKYGEVVIEKFGLLQALSCFNPDGIEVINRNEGLTPSRGELSTLKVYRESRKQWYSTTGVMVLQGKEWRDLRTKVQPYLMRPATIRSYTGHMQQIAGDLSHRIVAIRDQKKEITTFLDELYKWALESVAFIGLDTRLGCLDQDLSKDSEAWKMINAAQTTFDCINKLEAFSGNVPLWKWFPTPTWRKFVKAMDEFSLTALKHVNEAVERIKNNTDEDREATLLESMLCRKDLNVSDAVVTVVDMLFAGIDTTSHTTGFLLYHLARNMDKQEKLYKEIVEILPEKSNSLSKEQINELKYLKACIKEAMRLTPITRGVARTLNSDVVICGYQVSAGVNILGISQVPCRLEKYFKDADKFIPERWLDKENKPHPFVFVPFGIGPRSCIGRRLAELEMTCIITEIMRNFRVEYHYEDIDMCTRLVNIPDRPLKFRFIDRK